MEEEQKQDYKEHLKNTIDMLIDSGISVYDLDVINKKAIRHNYILRQKVKDVLQNNRNEIFSTTYLDEEQFKPYTMQIGRINKIEKELLEEKNI